eukprot:TRINITY_DN2568_c0_g1_i2.p1 TRINITY_DN2568_c0_g1~~TRINITY_DN2568_c0_g1_i2.p1  ORF type:complete len:255 (+),score=31.89 TRINITY_DN2568_c0_g1_i2:125-889(+)
MKEISATIKTNPDFVKAQKTKSVPITSMDKITKSIYQEENCGQTFLSIDIAKGGFATLKLICPSLFIQTGHDIESWEEFISGYTTSLFLIKSKHFRQQILGLSILPQTKNLQERLIDDIHKQLFLSSNAYFQELEMKYKQGDEVVYQIKQPFESFVNFLPEIQEILKRNRDIFHLRVFTLSQVPKTQFFIKSFLFRSDWYGGHTLSLSKRIELKNVPKKFTIQVVKWYLKKEITENDLYFVDEGIKARYCTAIV